MLALRNSTISRKTKQRGSRRTTEVHPFLFSSAVRHAYHNSKTNPLIGQWDAHRRVRKMIDGGVIQSIIKNRGGVFSKQPIKTYVQLTSFHSSRKCFKITVPPKMNKDRLTFKENTRESVIIVSESQCNLHVYI